MYPANEDFTVPLIGVPFTPPIFTANSILFYRVFLLLVGRDGVEPPESLTTRLQRAPLPLTVYLPI